MSFRSIFSAVLLTVGSAAGAGAADLPVPADVPAVVVDPVHYGMFGVGAHASYFNFDVADGLTSVVDTAAFDFIRQAENGFEFDAVGAGGTMHVVLPLSGSLLGATNFHFAFGGDAASDDENTTINLAPGEFLDILPIIGPPSAGAFVVGPGSAGLSVDVDFYRFYGAPTIGWGMGNITVNAGPLFEYKNYHLDADFNQVGGPGFLSLDEDVDVWSAGPMVAVMGRMPLGANFEGFLGGQGAVLYTSGQLDATQTSSNFGGLVRTASDSEEDLAFMGRAVGGLSYTAGRFLGSIYGAAEWRNDMYAIDNPRTGPGVNALVAGSFGPPDLDQTDMWNLSIGIKAGIRLGGGS